jgi:hypothetical protein
MPSPTDTPPEPPLLRVSGPGELAQAIPYLLGFHPSESLVVVGLRRGRVVVTARIDLVDVAGPGEDGTAVLAETLAAMSDSDVQRVVAVVFADAVEALGAGTGSLPWLEVADRLHLVAALIGVDVDEVALVSDNRIWSYECDEPSCCPPEGRILQADSTVAATAAYAGLVALPDRASLAALLTRRIDPLLLPARYEQLRAAERAQGPADARGNRSDVRALFAAARHFDDPECREALADPDLIRFAVALRRYPVRDSVWLGVDEQRIDGRALWRRLATALPAPYDAAPLFLFAWASYRAGDGAMARIAAERALESDPDYGAADLVLGALARALNPHRLPRLRPRERTGTGAVPRAARRAATRGGVDRRRR